MSIPDESATGVAATTAAPEARDGETSVIAASDAVTPLAWSQEAASDEVVPYPTTGTDAVEAPPVDTGWGWAVVVLAVIGASLAVVTSVSMIRGAHQGTSQAMTTTAEPWPAQVLAAPTQTAPLVCPPGTKPGLERNDPPDDGNFHHDCVAAETAPVTVVPPPVTVTQTVDPAPGPASVIPTPMKSDVAAFNRGIADAPPSEPMPSAALALDYGYEACNQIAAGHSRRDIENALADEHGLDFGSAVWIWIQASRKLCPDY